MEYEQLAKEIDKIQQRDCFKKPEQAEVDYLTNLGMPDDALLFYKNYNPIEVIELNGIRLLPISEIAEENSNYTPGYLLTPLGYCVVATTINGDVYCLRSVDGGYKVVIASHDEISADQTAEEIASQTVEISVDFRSFLTSFTEGQLVRSYYDVKN